MNQITNQTYVGDKARLIGQTALVRPAEKAGKVLAQFDKYGLHRKQVDLSHGWHEFNASEFQPTEFQPTIL